MNKSQSKKHRKAISSHFKKQILYAAFIDHVTLMEGTYKNLAGIFDSEEKAWDYLKTTPDYKNTVLSKDGVSRVYHFDGTLSMYYRVMPIQLNIGLYEDTL